MGSLGVEQPLWLMSSPVPQCQRQTNRSPVESPPIAKKFFRPDCSKKPQQSRSSLASVDSACKENRSILKRIDCSRPKSWQPASQTLRRVNFDQRVVVVVYDRADGEFVCCETQQLNTKASCKQQFVSRTQLARVHSNKSSFSSSALFYEQSAATSRLHCATSGRSADTLKPASHTGRPLPSVLAPVDSSSPPPVTSIDFTFHEDRSGRLWLSFTVALGRGVAAGDALVKANVAGDKVRVLGTRTFKCHDATTARQEFATRYALPMDVDPYAITARMDSAGNLFVEAPVVTGEQRRRTTAPPSQTASDIL